MLFGTLESRPTKLLERRVVVLREPTGEHSLQALIPDHTPDLKTFAKIGLFRPLQLLFTEPIVFFVSFMSATAFALVYPFTETLQVVCIHFGLSEKESTLPFLAAAIGVICSTGTRVYDHRLYSSLRRQRRVAAPEDKLFGFMLGVPALAIGLWQANPFRAK